MKKKLKAMKEAAAAANHRPASEGNGGGENGDEVKHRDILNVRNLPRSGNDAGHSGDEGHRRKIPDDAPGARPNCPEFSVRLRGGDGLAR
jgi:hypothetical protein